MLVQRLVEALHGQTRELHVGRPPTTTLRALPHALHATASLRRLLSAERAYEGEGDAALHVLATLWLDVRSAFIPEVNKDRSRGAARVMPNLLAAESVNDSDVVVPSFTPLTESPFVPAPKP